MRETKRFYGWPEDAQFLVPDGVRERFAEGVGARGAELSSEWERLLVSYEREHQSLERQIGAMQRRELPDGWDRDIPSFEPDAKGIATRKASNQVQNAIAANMPWLLSGSADLTDSTSVRLDEKTSGGDFQPENRAGRQLHFGIREHESAAVVQRALAVEAARRRGRPT